MKQKDIALILVVAFFSAIASFIVSGFLFASPHDRQQQVAVAPPLNAGFPTPDTRYFNSKSIDPTQLAQIGNSSNPNPFSGSSSGQ